MDKVTSIRESLWKTEWAFGPFGGEHAFVARCVVSFVPRMGPLAPKSFCQHPVYRGTSLIRTPPLLRPYSRTIPRVI